MLQKVASGAVYSGAQSRLDADSLTDTRTIYEDTNTTDSPGQECAEQGTNTDSHEAKIFLSCFDALIALSSAPKQRFGAPF